MAMIASVNLRFSCSAINNGGGSRTIVSTSDCMRRAVQLADMSAGRTAPHPNYGCVITSKDGIIVGEGFLYAHGGIPAELQALDAARNFSRAGTAFLNMEPSHFHADFLPVSSLLQAGISRVVIGIKNPMKHLNGRAILALRSGGVQVDVLGENLNDETTKELINSCISVNIPFMYRASSGLPFSFLKYAMTLDGKISTSSGHSLWISSETSRVRVSELRGRSDAIIVGGNTVLKDNPRLTARHGDGHSPLRVVMSLSLDLPDVANLWNVSVVPTIVMTQKGAKKHFQKFLASKGVAIVEFDKLNPLVVMEYLYDHGYMSVLWECGGTLAASAISSGVIHKVFAFVAPKIIGGKTAPSPVNELGLVKMTDALELSDVNYEKVGPDILISGYLQPLKGMLTREDTSYTSCNSGVIYFNKTWNPYGVFSNSSHHPILIPDENGNSHRWSTLEHYIQASKFLSVNDPDAKDCVREIKSAKSPEKAAQIGRSAENNRPDLVRCDWGAARISIMYEALKLKFSTYPHLKSLLLSTSESILAAASPLDHFWGQEFAPGYGSEGENQLGKLLMCLRSEFRGVCSISEGTICVNRWW